MPKGALGHHLPHVTQTYIATLRAMYCYLRLKVGRAQNM